MLPFVKVRSLLFRKMDVIVKMLPTRCDLSPVSINVLGRTLYYGVGSLRSLTFWFACHKLGSLNLVSYFTTPMARPSSDMGDNHHLNLFFKVFTEVIHLLFVSAQLFGSIGKFVVKL